MLIYSTNTRKCPTLRWIFFHPTFIPPYREVLGHSLVRSLAPLTREFLMSQNDLVLSHSALTSAAPAPATSVISPAAPASSVVGPPASSGPDTWRRAQSAEPPREPLVNIRPLITMTAMTAAAATTTNCETTAVESQGTMTTHNVHSGTPTAMTELTTSSAPTTHSESNVQEVDARSRRKK